MILKNERSVLKRNCSERKDTDKPLNNPGRNEKLDLILALSYSRECGNNMKVPKHAY